MFRGWKNVVEKLVKGPRDCAFGLRSLSAGVFGGFFRTIYMSCRAPLCCCVLSRSGGSSIDCVSLFLICGAFLAMMSERYYVIAQNRPNHLLMRS